MTSFINTCVQKFRALICLGGLGHGDFCRSGAFASVGALPEQGFRLAKKPGLSYINSRFPDNANDLFGGEFAMRFRPGSADHSVERMSVCKEQQQFYC
jgi:hypothetical protein